PQPGAVADAPISVRARRCPSATRRSGTTGVPPRHRRRHMALAEPPGLRGPARPGRLDGRGPAVAPGRVLVRRGRASRRRTDPRRGDARLTLDEGPRWTLDGES